MRLIKSSEFQAAITRNAWTAISNGRVAVTLPALCYETTFDPCGIVGADMSDCVLNQFMRGRIDSGLLQVVRTSGNSPSDGIVIDCMLSLEGYSGVPSSEYRFEFSQDYVGLASTMAWCLACGWEFDFLATRCPFGIRTGLDETLAVFWREGQPLNDTVPELLKNLEFEPSRSCIIT